MEFCALHLLLFVLDVFLLLVLLNLGPVLVQPLDLGKGGMTNLADDRHQYHHHYIYCHHNHGENLCSRFAPIRLAHHSHLRSLQNLQSILLIIKIITITKINFIAIIISL